MSNIVFTGISQEISRVNSNLKLRCIVWFCNVVCGSAVIAVSLNSGIGLAVAVVVVNGILLSLQILYINLLEHRRNVINRLNSKCEKSISVSDSVVMVECFYERFIFRKENEITGTRKLVCDVYERTCREE